MDTIPSPEPLRRRQLLLTGLAALPLAVAAATTFDASQAEAQQAPKSQTLTVVSYAVTKNAYDKIFKLFSDDWKKKSGQTVTFKGSYGGSGSQTRAVIDGLEADVVSLAMAADVTKIQQAGLIKPGWEKENPNNSTPINSTVVAFVRPGNPKKINNWRDLDNKNVDVVTANPKTSGGARWNFLALWGAITRSGGSEAQARNFITGVYKNAEVLPKDAREATDLFIKRKQGDVLLNWETEAILAKQKGEWTTPYKLFSPNILTEQPVTVVDKVVDRRGSRKVAEAFVKFLYTPQAQKIFVDNGFRPVTPQGKAYARGKFQNASFFKVSDFGGWAGVDKKFFGKGGTWDQIFARTR
ncbi:MULTISPECIES: sulfate ABC transporter substrate-binding protein [unclassified Synechococcus]|uniref:sulfate ABC transporter substrate-binding protein n=1 Tax=unclassified Synechococcus TaxID=2626047 RepID=UPI0020CF2C0E|nr:MULTISPECIES: sulfate ABC transporter substrate-binding protein [unclassified Synechococcus]